MVSRHETALRRMESIEPIGPTAGQADDRGERGSACPGTDSQDVEKPVSKPSPHSLTGPGREPGVRRRREAGCARGNDKSTTRTASPDGEAGSRGATRPLPFEEELVNLGQVADGGAMTVAHPAAVLTRGRRPALPALAGVIAPELRQAVAQHRELLVVRHERRDPLSEDLDDQLCAGYPPA